jgi:hypothetical protein
VYGPAEHLISGFDTGPESPVSDAWPRFPPGRDDAVERDLVAGTEDPCGR